LARQARITGTVVVRFDVGGDGRAGAITIVQGHPILITTIPPAIQKTVYPAACQGEMEVVYAFSFDEGLREENTTVIFRAPNEFHIAAPRPVLVVENLDPAPRHSWVRRLLTGHWRHQ
jgi:hypothetical protein